jgi:hypothetical protein
MIWLVAIVSFLDERTKKPPNVSAAAKAGAGLKTDLKVLTFVVGLSKRARRSRRYSNVGVGSWSWRGQGASPRWLAEIPG